MALLHNGVALRRLDDILGTRVVKRIWAVNRNKRVEPVQGGMHHDQTEYDLYWFGKELEQIKSHYSIEKGITVSNRVLLAPGKKSPYLDKTLFGG